MHKTKSARKIEKTVKKKKMTQYCSFLLFFPFFLVCVCVCVLCLVCVLRCGCVGVCFNIVCCFYLLLLEARGSKVFFFKENETGRFIKVKDWVHLFFMIFLLLFINKLHNSIFNSLIEKNQVHLTSN